MVYQRCLCLIFLFLVQHNHVYSQNVNHWGYHSRIPGYRDHFQWDTIPEHAQCNGRRQSPVNIPWKGLQIRDLPDITPAINLTGVCHHTTMSEHGVDFKFDINGGDCQATGSEGAHTVYNLAYFIYHTPSEHQINGKSYDGEVQFTFLTSDNKKALIVAVLLDATLSVDSLWVKQTFEGFGHANKNLYIANAREKFIPVLRGKWFNYQGSLTTPPCSEIVDWWISAIPVPISKNQLDTLKNQHKTLIRTDDGKNSRNIMPINGRDVKPLKKSWSFDSEDGYTDPDFWNTLYPACGTLKDFSFNQSPIDILYDGDSSKLKDIEPFLAFNTIGCNDFVWVSDLDDVVYKWKNVKHPHEKCEASGSKKSRKFEFKEIELTIPSEHTINSRPYDAEIKFIHQTKEGDEYLIISILLDATASLSNNYIEEILQPFYGDNRHNKELTLKTSEPYTSFLPLDKKWFNYHGSLTRPPCSEVVDAWVAAEPILITLDELKQIAKAHKLFDRSNHGRNARNTQDLNGRHVSPIPQPWAYHNRIGFLEPSKWKDQYPDCGKKQQSPIDIEYHGNIEDLDDILPKDGGLHIRVSGCKNVTFSKHHDHTDFKWYLNMQGDSCTARGSDKTTNYNLYSFQIHSPSEHTYNAEHYDAEIYFIHYSEAGDKVLIVSVFLEGTAEEDHPWINEIFNGMSNSIHEQVLNLENSHVSFLPYGKGHKWFNYQGSFTTPPCKEIVDWWLAAKPVKISPAQLKLLQTNQKYMIRNEMGANNRVPQDIIGREIRPLGHPWAYHERNDYLSPHSWYKRYPECGGLRQSPINFVFEQSMEFLPVIEPSLRVVVEGCKNIKWFGHHDHTDYKWILEKQNGDKCKAIGLDQSIDYDLEQFEIHSPSEHTINGKSYDGEVQFVHVNEAENKYLIIGVLLEIDDLLKPQGDPFIQDILDGFSTDPLEHYNQFLLKDDYDTFIPIASGWFNYHGSFTTPPCSEVVDWWITALPVKVNSAQMNFIKSQQSLQDRTDYSKNNRLPQPINARVIRPLEQPWAYHSNYGYLSPPDWKDVYPDCGKDEQSPIDVKTRGMDLSSLATPFPHLAIFVGGCKNVTWEGHPDKPYYSWNVVTGDSTCQATGRFDGIKYDFTRLVFRYPSEHSIDGEKFDAEMQFEHISTDKKKRLIISLLVSATAANPNLWIESIFNYFGTGVFSNNFEIENAHDMIIPLTYDMRWINYMGSLTTPPCTENTEWWITSKPIFITPHELDVLKQNQETMTRTKNGANNRPLQPQNGRKVKPMDGGGYVDLAAVAAGTIDNPSDNVATTVSPRLFSVTYFITNVMVLLLTTYIFN